MRPAGEKPAERLFTFRSAGWVLVLAGLVSVVVVLQVFRLRSIHRERVFGDGENRETYRFDYTSPLVPDEEIVPFPQPRNAIAAMVEPGSLTVLQLENAPDRKLRKLLVPSDRVIGVVIAAGDTVEARAYPLRVLNFHEVVNDTLGGREIAVTYHPLTDCAVVFDRTVSGKVQEFRVSGIGWRSSQLLFFKRETPGGEGLWSQILCRAITGPPAAAGEKLTVLPSHVFRWGDWKLLHPDTTIVQPDPAYRKQYPRMPYSNYRGTQIPKFDPGPRYPPPTDEREAWSTVMVLLGGAEPIPESFEVGAADAKGLGEPQLHCYWWAWHATRR